MKTGPNKVGTRREQRVPMRRRINGRKFGKFTSYRVLSGGCDTDRNKSECLVHHDRRTGQAGTTAGGCGGWVSPVCCLVGDTLGEYTCSWLTSRCCERSGTCSCGGGCAYCTDGNKGDCFIYHNRRAEPP